MYNEYNIGSDLLSEGSSKLYNSTRTNFNLFYRGIVVSSDDPLKLGRARIRIPSIHGSNPYNQGYVRDEALPWATPAVWSSAGNDMGTFDPPTAGNRVFVTFEGGDSQYPIYFGGIPTKIGNKKYYKPQVGIMMGATQEITTDDYNLDFVTGTERTMFKSFKGATIIVDDFDGREYIKIIDQAGQTFTMGNYGDALGRRNGELGLSSQAFMELKNNRGEVIKITDGEVFIDGDKTIINSQNVEIPNWHGGGPGPGPIDAYTKAETDALLANKSRVFFDEPTIPYQKDDLWYNGSTIYKCIHTRNNGHFSLSDWEIDSSYMTPDQVERYVKQESDKILEIAKATYVTPAYVDEKLNYDILIVSSQGDIFKNGVIETTLTAYVRQGNRDVTNKFNDNQFVWSRASDDPIADAEWNRKYIGGCRSVRITTDDVKAKATFNVELVDEINVVKYVKEGLIELFDGYDAPSADGDWQSMIRTNTAIIPTTGVTYDNNKHGYVFTGQKYAMQLYKPISLKPGQTYEFVSELNSYTEVQNLLCSNEEENDTINNRIACAVAGHLQIRKHGYTLNAGNVKINRKTYLSIRYVDEDNVEIYYNGDYAGRFIQSGWTSEPALLNNIGKWCNGIIYSIRVYNRLLTPAEIETNFNEDKERFS